MPEISLLNFVLKIFIGCDDDGRVFNFDIEGKCQPNPFNIGLDLVSEYIEEWVPKKGEIFWYILSFYTPECSKYDPDAENDKVLIATGNYYKTEELCQAAADKKYKRDVITHKLEKLAERLNANVKIDWGNAKQIKYALQYDYVHQIIDQDNTWGYRAQNTIYCLSENFRDEAIKEIGKEDLENYLR